MASAQDDRATEDGPDRPPLSRDRVVQAAVALLSEADDISIRDLAARLDVSPMAIYRHVENKQDLLESAVNAMLDRYWRAAASTSDWQEWTIEAADRLRGFLVERPAALAVYLSHPVTSPTALERMAACLEVLRVGVRDEQRARSAFAAVHSYTIGFAALESARESLGPDASGRADELGGFDETGSDEVTQLAAIASPGQFRAGLRFLLAGLTGPDVRDNANFGPST